MESAHGRPILAADPPSSIYIFLGRYFIRGLLAGSLKG